MQTACVHTDTTSCNPSPPSLLPYQMRKNGDSMLLHCLETAILVADMGLDADTVAAALLHETLKDGDRCMPQLEVGDYTRLHAQWAAHWCDCLVVQTWLETWLNELGAHMCDVPVGLRQWWISHLAASVCFDQV